MNKQIFNNYIDLIKDIQKSQPQLVLCGSLALMCGDLLDIRAVSDIDFVIHKKHIHKVNFLLYKDYPYQNAERDGYESYSTVTHDSEFGYYKVNILAHNDNYEIETQTMKGVTIQNLDTIMKWKAKYNRPKDLKDINNISNNLIEKLITEE